MYPDMIVKHDHNHRHNHSHVVEHTTQAIKVDKNEVIAIFSDTLSYLEQYALDNEDKFLADEKEIEDYIAKQKLEAEEELRKIEEEKKMLEEADKLAEEKHKAIMAGGSTDPERYKKLQEEYSKLLSTPKNWFFSYDCVTQSKIDTVSKEISELIKKDRDYRKYPSYCRSVFGPYHSRRYRSHFSAETYRLNSSRHAFNQYKEYIVNKLTVYEFAAEVFMTKQELIELGKLKRREYRDFFPEDKLMIAYHY